MLREKIKAAWSALVAKRTAGGWCLFILFALFWISDRWDSLNSLIGKLKKMGPVAKFLVDAAQSPFVQLCIFISGAIWIGVAAVISSRRTGSNSAAVTFDDAIIVPSGHGDGIQRIVHHPTSDVTAKLLPEPKQGAPVLVEIVNKSDTVARLHTARLLGIDGNGNEELLLGPRHIIGIHEWKPLPFVMDSKSRITIAFAGMCLRMLPDKFTAYLVEVELEDETKIRTDKRIKFASVIQPEKDSRRFGVKCSTDLYSDNILSGNIPGRYLQAQITASEAVSACKAYLREIRGGTKNWQGQEQLTFEPSESVDSLSKAVFQNIKYRLDVLLLVSTGDVVVCNHNRIWARWPRLNDIFAAHGPYDLVIDIGGENAAGETFKLRFDWTGNRRTSFLTGVKRLV